MGGGTEGVEEAPALPPCCRLAPSFAQRGFTCLPGLNLTSKTDCRPTQMRRAADFIVRKIHWA